MNRHPTDLARCDGVLSTDPAASLCRRCARAEPSAESTRMRTIEPLARVDSSALGSRIHCEMYVRKGTPA